MIDHDTVERIHAAANIVEIVGDFIPLKKKGVNYQACCPFHNEKTPSFVVSPSNGFFKCFGCGAGGGAITFVMKHESLSYPDALRYVAKKYGIEVEEKQLSEEGQKRATKKESMMTINQYAAEYFSSQLKDSAEGRNVALSYFRERGFTDATIEKFALGYCSSKGSHFSDEAVAKGYSEELLIETGLTIKREQGGYYDRFSSRVIFPISTFTGRVIGFGGRTMRTDKKTAKYLNSPESEVYHKSDTLYGIYQSKRAMAQKDKVFLVEGYTDVISMHQNGIENVVASSGTSLTEGQVLLLSRITKNVTVLYDGDSAGIKASIRGIDILLKGGLNVRVVPLPEGEDPDSFARSHSSQELEEYLDVNEIDFLSFKSKLLIDEVKDDPIGRATVITEVINSIAVIDDDIVRSQYIKECSQLLDCDSEMVISEVNKRRAFAKDGEQGVHAENNRRKKEQYNSRKAAVITPPMSTSEKGRRELVSYEKELCRYLMVHGNEQVYISLEDETAEGVEEQTVELSVAELIINELEIDNITFTDVTYKRLFDIYCELYHSKSEEDVSAVDTTLLINNPDSSISGFIVDILAREKMYVPSKLWEKVYDSSVVSDSSLSVDIPKSIELYKSKVLEYKTMLLQEQLETTTDDMVKLKILKEITLLKAAISSILKKHSRIR